MGAAAFYHGPDSPTGVKAWALASQGGAKIAGIEREGGVAYGA